MAKRYISYVELIKLVGKGDYKPGGTLGRHYLTVQKINESMTVYGYGTNGECSNAKVREGETLGYNCGSVWTVPNPENVKDPLRRAMLELKIGRDRLKWVDNFDEVCISEVDTFQREGCVPFFDGTDIGASCEFTVVTRRHRFIRPIEQRCEWGDIFVLKGTPRGKVAEFLREVWAESPSTGLVKSVMVIDSVMAGSYHEIK